MTTTAINLNWHSGEAFATNETVPCDYTINGSVVIVRDGDLILATKNENRGWELPGGHLDDTDFSFEHGAVREVFEETGYVLAPAALSYVGALLIHNATPENGQVRKYDPRSAILFFSSEGNSIHPLAASLECVDAAWMPADEMRAIELSERGYTFF